MTRYYQHPDGSFKTYRDSSKDFKQYGTAPTVMFDSMPKTYHHGVEREIESRREWNAADRDSGSYTFGSVEDAKPKIDAANAEKARKAELREASSTALQAYKQNPKDTSDRIRTQDIERLETLEKLGIEV